MAEVTPYLPDIMQGVVARVDAVMFARLVDPFHVFFDKGVYRQVAKKVYSEGAVKMPLVWFIMNFAENRGSDFSVFGEVICDITIVMPTEDEYTQQQRDDISFKPRLIPIYEELMNQISKEKSFSAGFKNKIHHTRIIRPYWGGGNINGPGTANLFEKLFVDEIYIQNLRLKVKRFVPCALSMT